MKKKIRLILLSIIVLSLAGLGALVFVNYTEREHNRVSVSLTGPEGPSVNIEKVRYSGTKDGRLEWELTADSATYFKDRDLTVLESVELVFYSRDGKSYTMTSRSGKYWGEQDKIDASGEVTVVSIDGYRLQSEELTYLNPSREVTSDVAVKLSSPTIEVKGVGLYMDIDAGKLRVLKDVRTEIRDVRM